MICERQPRICAITNLVADQLPAPEQDLVGALLNLRLHFWWSWLRAVPDARRPCYRAPLLHRARGCRAAQCSSTVRHYTSAAEGSLAACWDLVRAIAGDFRRDAPADLANALVRGSLLDAQSE